MTIARPKPPGRLEGALTRLFMKTALVTECRTLDESFRLVTLSGEALRGVAWTPGQKVQIAVGGWAYRTYTPISWDSVAGSTQLLLFLHGDAPAALWGRALEAGDSCTLFGPRASLDLEALDRPALLFGDETSFGLAHALRQTERGADGVRLVFEVTEREEATRVLGQLGMGDDVDLIERQPGDAHLDEVDRVTTDHLQTGAIQSCALSGKASSIQRVNKLVRKLGLASPRIRTRAYWAPGKIGLD